MTTSDLKKNPGVCVIVSRFSDCKTFLMNKSPSSCLRTTIGVIDPPFGRVRQAMVELIDATLGTNNAFVFDSAISSGLIPLIIDLFFQYKWNNFLQESVVSILSVLLKCPNEKSVRYLIEDCHLPERIIAAESENKEFLLETKASYGYISFLTGLSLLIDGHSFVHDIPGWKSYITDVVTPRHNLESQLLGGIPK